MKITFDPEKRIDLYNRDFDEMRAALDTAIQQAMGRMLDKGVYAAAITLKIDIGLTRDVIDDANAATGMREAIHPEICYKLSFTMQHKGSMDGDVIPKGSDELLMDNSGSFYLVSKEEASGQLSMFNSWDEYREALT